MGVANIASSAASGAASSAASQATSSVASNAAAKGASVGGSLPASSMPAPKTSSPAPMNGGGLPSSSPSNGSHSSLPDIEEKSSSVGKDTHSNVDRETNSGQSEIEQENSPSMEENVPEETTDSKENSKEKKSQDIDDGKYHAKDNQEVGPGQKIDEDGNVVDTGNKKFTKALAVGAATYFGGAEGGETANALAKTDAGNKLTGVVADQMDKSVAGKITEDLGDSGAADAILDTADTVSAAKSGDVKGALKSGKSAIKNLGKTIKHYALIIGLSLLVVLGPIIMVGVVIAAVCGPVLGGFMDVTSAFGEFVDDVGDFFTGENDITGTTGGDNLEEIMQNADQIVAEVPDYSSLTDVQQGIVAAAAAGVASGRPYSYGGKPTGPGLSGIPTTGIDCSGFVGWAIWTATNKKPGALGTSTMVANIGTIFEEIPESELKPGDIGLKHKNSGSNHTGIYAGNGMWLHAANSTSGLIKSNYKSFTVYLRYVG